MNIIPGNLAERMKYVDWILNYGPVTNLLKGKDLNHVCEAVFKFKYIFCNNVFNRVLKHRGSLRLNYHSHL